MADASKNKDQQHPQESRDRQTVDTLLAGEPTDFNLAELGRLRVRYRHFPGARTIQEDLNRVLENWQMTEDELFERTRQIHALAQVYRGLGGQREDWS